jgi:hypothetical protein
MWLLPRGELSAILFAMTAQRANNNADSSPRQGSDGHISTASPSNVVSLLTLVEIRDRWGKSAETVYRAVRDRKLHAYGRDGHQKYYSERELIAAFGDPDGRGPLNSGKLSGSDNGRKQESFEFDAQRAA